MEFLTGRTVRTIVKSARTAVESFWLDVDSPRSEAPLSKRLTKDERILDAYPFESLPLTEPALVYSRRLGAASHRDDLVRGFGGNLSVTPKPVPVLRIDASELDPLNDDQFWPIIDMLDGHMWESSINRVAVHLAKQPEEFVLRFAQAAALKMFELNSPNRWLAGATIARGRIFFESALADSTVVETAKASDLSWGIVLLAGRALDRQRRQSTQIVTRWSPTPERALLERAVEPAQVARTLEEIILPPNIFGTWWTARYLLRIDADVVERLVLFHMSHQTDQDVAGELVARNDASDFGGTVLSPIDMFDTHLMEPMRYVIAVVKRRSSLSLESYLAKHFDPVADA